MRGDSDTNLTHKETQRRTISILGNDLDQILRAAKRDHQEALAAAEAEKITVFPKMP